MISMHMMLIQCFSLTGAAMTSLMMSCVSNLQSAGNDCLMCTLTICLPLSDSLNIPWPFWSDKITTFLQTHNYDVSPVN